MLIMNLRKSLFFGAHQVFVGSSLGKVYQNIYKEDQERIPGYQTRQYLIGMLNHCQSSVPYYAEIISRTGNSYKNDPETYLTRFPILTKEIIRQNSSRLYSNDLSRRKWAYNSSGGSTGEPVRLIQDRQYTDHQMAIQWLSYNWAGRN